jgi:hypothetical protein
MPNDNYIGMDRASEGADYDAGFLPCDTCNGELRETCGGCDKYDAEGNEI